MRLRRRTTPNTANLKIGRGFPPSKEGGVGSHFGSNVSLMFPNPGGSWWPLHVGRVITELATSSIHGVVPNDVSVTGGPPSSQPKGDVTASCIFQRYHKQVSHVEGYNPRSVARSARATIEVSHYIQYVKSQGGRFAHLHYIWLTNVKALPPPWAA